MISMVVPVVKEGMPRVLRMHDLVDRGVCVYREFQIKLFSSNRSPHYPPVPVNSSINVLTDTILSTREAFVPTV